MAKILLFSSHILWETHYETELEIIQRHIDQGDEVIQLYCASSLPLCDANPEKAFSRCIQCMAKKSNGLALLSKKIPSISFDLLGTSDNKAIQQFKWNANTIDELKEIKYQNFDVGYAVASSLISLLSNPNPILSEHQDKINLMMHSALEMYHSILNQLQKHKVDVLYVFNGRLMHAKAAFKAALHLGVKVMIHERGSTYKQFELYENHLPHDLAKMAIKIKKFWDDNADEQDKINKAAYFFENRRKGNILSWKSFTDQQEKGSLPEGFDPNKKNIVIFNSSEFEFAAVGPEWNNPLYKNQNEGILNIVSNMLPHSDYHFYLRLHPNLASADPVNYAQIVQFKSPNLSIIMPDALLDSYHLLDNAYKVIGFGSTMGIEATYWNKVSIMAGHSMYETLDVVYRPQTHNELISMLLDDSLIPKDKLGTYVFGYYYAASGIPFKYYEPSSYKEGVFKGVKLNGEIQSNNKASAWVNRYWKFRKYPILEKAIRKQIIQLLKKT
jgi:hypothetical protein